MRRLGFIGLGSMGHPMASRLVLSGADVTVFDIVPERRDELAAAGAAPCESPREAAHLADAVFLMVSDGAQASAALFGDEGVALVPGEGTAIVIMSTIGPTAIVDIDHALRARGFRTLDAPVSGGVKRAETGELLIMAAGEQTLFTQLKPMLEKMGSNLVHCGERVGEGQTLKLVTQLLCGIHIAAAAEALAFASALGLDRSLVIDIVRQGAADSFMLGDRGMRMLERDFIPSRSALDLFVKDMDLVLTAAKARKFPTPLASTTAQLYLTASALGLGREDDSAIVKVFEDWSDRSYDESD